MTTNTSTDIGDARFFWVDDFRAEPGGDFDVPRESDGRIPVLTISALLDEEADQYRQQGGPFCEVVAIVLERGAADLRARGILTDEAALAD